jgi:hypothetical protein
MPFVEHYSPHFHHPFFDDIYSHRARLVDGGYALIHLPSPQRVRASDPLAHHITNDERAIDDAYALGHRNAIAEIADASAIDREGPYTDASSRIRSPYLHRYRTNPPLYDDLDLFDSPRPGWHFPHSYPISGLEPGGSRLGAEQIRAYNRDVLRHNNQIARRRATGVPSEYLMLHPMMDPLGRFPPGFDRPMNMEDYLAVDGKQFRSIIHKDHGHPLFFFDSSHSNLSSKPTADVFDSQNPSSTPIVTSTPSPNLEAWNGTSCSTPPSPQLHFPTSAATSNRSSFSNSTAPAAFPNNLPSSSSQRRAYSQVSSVPRLEPPWALMSWAVQVQD